MTACMGFLPMYVREVEPHWSLAKIDFVYECADCGRQTSVSAGTLMHASKLPLTIWFWAAFLMATQAAAEKAFKRVEEIFAKYPIEQG